MDGLQNCGQVKESRNGEAPEAQEAMASVTLIQEEARAGEERPLGSCSLEVIAFAKSQS